MKKNNHLVVCLVGIPGSGKSTLARRLVDSAPSSGSCCVIEFDLFKSRDDALTALREAISKKDRHVIADDNCYYKSMRKEIFRMARDGGARFVQVLLDPPLETCLHRNSQRIGPARIPDEIVSRMFERLERPSNRGWDRCIVGTGEETIQSLEPLSWSIPVVVAPKQEEANAFELLDLKLRKEISEQVAAARAEDRAALAAQLNQERKQRLKAAKKML